MTHTSTNSHAVLIAEIAELRKAAREAEKAMSEVSFGFLNVNPLSKHDTEVEERFVSALTRLRESLKGAGDE